MTTGYPLIVWARDAAPPVDTPVLLWSSFGFESQHPDSISLPKYIEQHAHEIRSQLLSFLSEAKFISDGSRTLEEALRTPEELSSWWLSFPSLKQWGKRQSIPIACRLIAIEQIIGEGGIHDTRVESDNEHLRELIERVLLERFTMRYRVRRALFRGLIHPLRALGSLGRYLNHTRRLPIQAQAQVGDIREGYAFFDYFAGHEHARSENAYYTSPYWGEAPRIANSPHWFHIYPKNVDRIGLRKAQEEISQLNHGTGPTHTLFLGKLQASDVLAICRTYITQQRVHRRFRSKLLSFRTSGSRLALWNVFEDEWDDSIIGSTALRHLVLLTTTDSLVSSMPRFSTIFYLMENQPWELALVHCVRRRQKGRLVGVAHSTIRFWDLRYFSDKAENAFTSPQISRPFPDQILVNGEIGRRLLLESGYPHESISVVEALRYMYLHDLRRVPHKQNGHVLLLGDFLEHANETLVTIFRTSLQRLTSLPQIKVRSHPICPLTKNQLGDLFPCVSPDGLSELLRGASVVVTTAASSSAAESAALGIPTIVVLDARSLNYSPFRQTNNVYVVENAEQLGELIEHLECLESQPSEEIFCLDPNYPRWRKELAPSRLT